jgi:hypothetical protein
LVAFRFGFGGAALVSNAQARQQYKRIATRIEVRHTRKITGKEFVQFIGQPGFRTWKSAQRFHP